MRPFAQHPTCPSFLGADGGRYGTMRYGKDDERDERVEASGEPHQSSSLFCPAPSRTANIKLLELEPV